MYLLCGSIIATKMAFFSPYYTDQNYRSSWEVFHTYMGSVWQQSHMAINQLSIFLAIVIFCHELIVPWKLLHNSWYNNIVSSEFLFYLPAHWIWAPSFSSSSPWKLSRNNWTFDTLPKQPAGTPPPFLHLVSLTLFLTFHNHRTIYTTASAPLDSIVDWCIASTSSPIGPTTFAMLRSFGRALGWCTAIISTCY